MLECKVDNLFISLSCGECKKCQGKSKLDYPFQKDLNNSDDLVLAIMQYIGDNTKAHCKKTDIDKNPDINVYDANKNIVCRIEAKYLEGQAFMKSKQTIDLYPREVIVVDEPKLDSYTICKENDRKEGKDIPIYVVWKFDRPCEDIGGITIFQEIDELNRIRTTYGRVRAYERRTAQNDYRNGVKLGVTKKYHFSIRECMPIENIIELIDGLLGA